MNVSPSEWSLLQELFHRARELPPDARRAFVDSELTDGPLRRHLARLLEFDTTPQPLLDRGVGAIAAALLHPRPDLAVPSALLGPYKVLDILGHGGMGVVYLAERADVGGRVALKVLWDAPFSPALRARFDEEQRTLARLRHPGIVPLYHAGETDDGAAWFSMEYVDGERITTYARDHQLTIRDRLRVFAQVCAAVMAAHEQLVVHGDLKPSNILVTRDGRVRLLDFGVSRRLDRPDSRPDSGTRLTPAYAAPEVRGDAPISVQADVYALGRVLYELLVDRLPRSDAAGRDRPSQVSPHRTSGAGRREDWTDIDLMVRRATAAEPSARYPSVEALRRDLDRYLADLPLEDAPGGAWYRLAKATRRHRGPTVLGALSIVAITSGLFAHDRSLRSVRDAALSEAARNSRLRAFLEQLFEGGGVPADSIGGIRVSTILDNGAREARTLTADPSAQIDMLASLGIVSERIGAFERADTLARETVRRATGLFGAADPRTLDLRVLAARVRFRLKDLPGAERELRSVLAAIRPENGSHPVAAEVRFSLGSLLRESGRAAEGLPLLREAVAIRALGDTTTGEYAASVRELGNAVASVGDLVAADSIYRRALAATRRLRGSHHPEVAYLLANLGHIAGQRAQLAEAEDYQREAARILSSWYGEEHYLAAVARMQIMQTLVRARRFAEARELAPGIIASYEKSPDIGPNDHVMAVVRGTLAAALSGLGDRRGALQQYERALVIHHASEGPNGRNTLVDESNVARMRLEMGDVAKAVMMLRSVRERAVASLGARSLTTANVSLRLAAALSKARRHREVIELSVPALALTDTLTGGPTAASSPAREILASSYAAVGDTTAAARVRSTLRSVTNPRAPAAKSP
jgi:eukaryotic-like serine/threonine-protein kinase